MPVTKRIVVLANSVKHDPGRCIAGREIIQADAGSRPGSWVRPVSSIGEGELHPHHLRVPGGGVIGVLAVFDVPRSCRPRQGYIGTTESALGCRLAMQESRIISA
jgi:hypothetical protein